jgi:hypothetical protein
MTFSKLGDMSVHRKVMRRGVPGFNRSGKPTDDEPNTVGANRDPGCQFFGAQLN